MLKPLLLLSALVMSGFTLFPETTGGLSQEPAPAGQPTAPPTAQPTQAAPPPAATHPATTISNPVKPTAEGHARAKKQYGYDCEMCHAASGDGKSDLAKDMKLTMTDLTDPKTLAGKTDGEIFDIIKIGKGQMPGEGDREKPDELWNMVLYVRSLSKGAAKGQVAPTTKPAI